LGTDLWWLRLLLAFWFSVGFYTVHVGLVGRFALNVDAYAQFFGLLLVYTGFFEFVWAKAFCSDGFFAVLFGYNGVYVMHLFASFLLFVAVASCVAKFVAWAQFFCAFAAVVESSDVFACASHTAEDSAGMLWLRYPADVFISFYGRRVGVDEYNFEPFVFTVFANPVAV
jgi:hypothetical protein